MNLKKNYKFKKIILYILPVIMVLTTILLSIQVFLADEANLGLYESYYYARLNTKLWEIRLNGSSNFNATDTSYQSSDAYKKLSSDLKAIVDGYSSQPDLTVEAADGLLETYVSTEKPVAGYTDYSEETQGDQTVYRINTPMMYIDTVVNYEVENGKTVSHNWTNANATNDEVIESEYEALPDSEKQNSVGAATSESSDYGYLSEIDSGEDLIVSLALVFIDLILLVTIIIELIKFILEIVEQYLVSVILVFFFPLGASFCISASTVRISISYLQMFLSSLFLLIVDGILFKGFFALVNEENLTSIVGGFFIIAYLKLCQRMDSHMKSMGLSTAQTGGNLLSAAAGAYGALKALPNMGKDAVGVVRNGMAKPLKVAGTLTGNTALRRAGTMIGKEKTESLSQAANAIRNTPFGGILARASDIRNSAADISRSGNRTGMTSFNALNGKMKMAALEGVVGGKKLAAENLSALTGRNIASILPESISFGSDGSASYQKKIMDANGNDMVKGFTLSYTPNGNVTNEIMTPQGKMYEIPTTRDAVKDLNLHSYANSEEVIDTVANNAHTHGISAGDARAYLTGETKTIKTGDSPMTIPYPGGTTRTLEPNKTYTVPNHNLTYNQMRALDKDYASSKTKAVENAIGFSLPTNAGNVSAYQRTANGSTKLFDDDHNCIGMFDSKNNYHKPLADPFKFNAPNVEKSFEIGGVFECFNHIESAKPDEDGRGMTIIADGRVNKVHELTSAPELFGEGKRSEIRSAGDIGSVVIVDMGPASGKDRKENRKD